MFLKCLSGVEKTMLRMPFIVSVLLSQDWYIIYVADRGRPTLNCSSDFTQTTDLGKSAALVVWETPSSSDNSGVVPHVSCNPASNTTFSIGETGVNCTAIDNSGNKASCEFYVNIIGNANNVNYHLYRYRRRHYIYHCRRRRHHIAVTVSFMVSSLLLLMSMYLSQYEAVNVKDTREISI